MNPYPNFSPEGLRINAETPILTDNSKPPILPAHILVVEDDAVVRNLLTIVLSNAGYVVDCAEDGEAGWDALAAQHFDLLITDHDMPRLSGLDLLRRLRAGQRNLPVIMVSGRIPWEATDLPALLSPGAALQKPFTTAQFLAHVRANLPATSNAST